MRYFLSFFALVIVRLSLAQGCSDAGFCTMGAMKPDQNYNRRIQVKLRSIEFTHYTGLTRFKDVIYNYVADVNVGLNSKTTFQVKVPYVFVNGALANTGGLGDLSVSLTRNIITREAFQINATVGSKIPTGKTNIRNAEGQSLPMYNQTGLGTYDGVAGLSFITAKWLFATGIQRPFGDINSTFLWSDWVGDPLEKKANEYTQSRSLKRGTDIMFRVERNFRFTNFNFSAGLLPIYRLNKDIINIPVVDDTGTVTGYRDKIIDGSEGLALTFLVSGGYQFNTRMGLKMINGFRLIKRHTNPDGLSREYVNNVSFIYKF